MKISTLKQRHLIAVVEDDPGLRELLQEELESAGYRVIAFETAELLLVQLDEQFPALIISDIRLPGMSGLELLGQLQQRNSQPPLILITAFGTVDQAVDALRQGADDFLTKPLDLEHLLVSVSRVLDYHQLRNEVEAYRRSVKAEQQGPGGIIGASRVMRQLYSEIEQIAAADGSVLILGESGTGKELVAQALHQLSQRRDGPFLAVNCAGIPSELLESEFFGHAAGAFTGAQKARAGLLKEADGGTLLLDEIGEMPLPLQAKLLRVLQEGTMRPVGSDQEVRVDVRILAATHQDLEQRVAGGEFRADLFYRLETFSLHVPPLRQRGDDIELLAEHFIDQLQQQQPKSVQGLSSAARDLLYAYRFPGNVRELQNAIERAYTFCDGEFIEPAHLPARLRQQEAQEVAAPVSAPAHWPSMQELQADYVRKVMVYTQGNKQQAARILGVTRRTLYRWLTNDDEH
ncbi:mutant NtrC activator [Pseudidiomarina salinarum]|uniref:Mutant NtrC activator n=1 Tax=Pseudidiomarina salinarum TaxID=435908 RepID=A0A094JEK8_9GAMM|nr:sigma-54 dependent transcriptional regulator [Pseudidiomarina salinarum]KFZ31006.1 mutant NtrC activator [Pseudidiomarina salinarum]RUO71490.1 sigma-54-dependent Fis family transcriptional regulator [Pseudidiomarina salinarum]